ncbi:MAG: septal ring lytic transglycosylase RlpA family protein [Kofleriaceae bacterium]|nr:septal ring lytic transglycosylase RlpA family protein [Kofleriaceae bacterium]
MLAKTVLSRRPLLVLLVAAFVLSCGGPVLQAAKGSSVTGKASWYGGKFHGRKTASGERFNKNALTAAHRKLPFGTKVRVTHLGNGKSVIVRINDRGPFGNRGRILDLSEAAATRLGMKRAGVARIKLEVLSVGKKKKSRRRKR